MTNKLLKSNHQRAKISISHVAKLANLPISEKESEIFTSQLIKILDYIDKIEEADTTNIEPTYNVSSNKNITRADNSSTSLTQKESLQNARQSKNGFFVTKGVFEE